MVILLLQRPTDLLVQGGLFAAVALGLLGGAAGGPARPPVQSARAGGPGGVAWPGAVSWPPGSACWPGPPRCRARTATTGWCCATTDPAVRHRPVLEPACGVPPVHQTQTGRRLTTPARQGLAVAALRRVRMRLATLDRYDGEEWDDRQRHDDRHHGGPVQRMDTTVDNPHYGTALRVAGDGEETLPQRGCHRWAPDHTSLPVRRPLAPPRRAPLRRRDLDRRPCHSREGARRLEFTSILRRRPADPGPWPRGRAVLFGRGGPTGDPMLTQVLASPAPPMRKVFVLASDLRDTGYFGDGPGPAEERFNPAATSSGCSTASCCEACHG